MERKEPRETGQWRTEDKTSKEVMMHVLKEMRKEAIYMKQEQDSNKKEHHSYC